MTEAMASLSICIPIYDDWTSALSLLEHIDRVAPTLQARIRVLFVDDGSRELLPAGLARRPVALTAVRVLRLRRNLGHQRAIAIGLTHLFMQRADDAVLVMDGDGEDNPDTIPTLLDRWRHHHGTSAVFATRSERCETLSFRVGYWCYKALYRLLVGRSLNVGNFSIVPRAALSSLVAVSELWNHYAAAVLLSRVPVATVPLARAQRIAGRSKMSFVGLVVHGLSAISVNSSVVAVRILVVVATLMLLLIIAIAGVAGIRLGSDLAIPGWASSTVGALVVMLLNLGLVSMFMVLFALRSRSESAFVPLRDFQMYIAEELVLFSGGRVVGQETGGDE